MRYRTLFGMFTALLFIAATPAFSQSLHDWEFNIGGIDYYPLGGATFATVPGLSPAGFNATTGLGTYTLTFNPGAGSYYVGAWFFDPVGIPFYNEYGVINNPGSAAADQQWQIDIPEYDAISKNHGSGTIIDNLASGTLDGSNSVPGTTSNYLSDCGANGGGAIDASCNDLVSMAQGFNFTLAAGQEEVLTFTLSSTDPGGFSLQDVHPVDGANDSAASVFYSASAATCDLTDPACGGAPPPAVPEPASVLLFGTVAGLLGVGMRRRLAKS